MPAMILSSVDLPHPLRPMMASVSPLASWKVTSASTGRSRKRRGRNSASAWSRTVLRWTSGMRNVLARPETSSTAIALQVLSHPWRQRAEEQHADARQRDQRVRGRGDDEDPGRERGLVEQVALGLQRDEAVLGGLGEEVPQEQPDDEVEAIGRIAAEDEREHRDEHEEHREGLQQRPHEAADRGLVPRLEVGADERPREAGEGPRRQRALPHAVHARGLLSSRPTARAGAVTRQLSER